MVRSRLLILAVAACALAAGGAWLILDARQQRAREFFSAPQDYDVTNGQKMRPRW